MGVTEDTYDYAPTRFIILKTDPANPYNTTLVQGQYKYGRREVFIRIKHCEPGEYLVLADLDFPHKTPEKSFSLTCYSQGKSEW